MDKFFFIKYKMKLNLTQESNRTCRLTQYFSTTRAVKITIGLRVHILRYFASQKPGLRLFPIQMPRMNSHHRFHLLGLHTPSTSVIQPSGHVQIMVLTGTVSRTSQRAFSRHGLMTGQGSMHFSRMHTNLSEQSRSTLHSGSPSSSTTRRSQ